MLQCRFLDTRFTTHDGYYILVAVRNAGAFNRWMYRQIAPYVGQRVLEAGCGIGNLTELLLDSDRLVASDFDPFYVEMIEPPVRPPRELPHRPDGPDPGRGLRAARRRAARHDHLPERARAHRRRRGGARPLLPAARSRAATRSSWCPQHPWLYSPTDKTLGHERRYTDRRARATSSAGPGFEVVHQQGFNRLGTLGWYVSGKLLGKEHLSPGQMKTYQPASCPLAKLIERIPGWPALSTIAVGRKPP